MIKYPCLNVTTMTYSGKEFSPLGLGISAEGHDIGTVMTGRDSVKWMVKIKNNRKVWVRYDNNINKMVHEEQSIKEEDGGDDEIPVETSKSDVATEPSVSEPSKQKKPTNYVKFLNKRKNELRELYKNSKTSKEIYDEVLKEWKELKQNPKQLQKVIGEL